VSLTVPAHHLRCGRFRRFLCRRGRCFGGKINVGKIDDISSSINSSGGFFYNAATDPG
jgi:hypothetical protein